MFFYFKKCNVKTQKEKKNMKPTKKHKNQMYTKNKKFVELNKKSTIKALIFPSIDKDYQKNHHQYH